MRPVFQNNTNGYNFIQSAPLTVHTMIHNTLSNINITPWAPELLKV